MSSRSSRIDIKANIPPQESAVQTILEDCSGRISYADFSVSDHSDDLGRCVGHHPETGEEVYERYNPVAGQKEHIINLPELRMSPYEWYPTCPELKSRDHIPQYPDNPGKLCMHWGDPMKNWYWRCCQCKQVISYGKRAASWSKNRKARTTHKNCDHDTHACKTRQCRIYYWPHETAPPKEKLQYGLEEVRAEIDWNKWQLDHFRKRVEVLKKLAEEMKSEGGVKRVGSVRR